MMLADVEEDGDVLPSILPVLCYPVIQKPFETQLSTQLQSDPRLWPFVSSLRTSFAKVQILHSCLPVFLDLIF